MTKAAKTAKAAKAPRQPGKVRQRLQLWRAQYRPKLGLLWPGQKLQHTLTPAYGAHERPVVATPTPGDLNLEVDDATCTVKLTNTTIRPVPYLIVIVPHKYAAVGLIPWLEVLRQLPLFAKNIQLPDVLNILREVSHRGGNS